MLDKIDLLEYEVRSSWWASLISNNFLQNLTARYFAHKVKEKYSRYLYSYKYAESSIKEES